MKNKCGCCSTIYSSFQDYRNHDPFCSGSGFVNHYDEDEDKTSVVFYVPSKDSYYDKWFDFAYCPVCGKRVKQE